MIIEKRIYDRIISYIKPAPPETGGILGSVNGIITHFAFDSGLLSKNVGCYYPDTRMLNDILREWNRQNINFCGIIHSHLDNQMSLSSGDMEYIKEIMIAVSPQYKTLYFPLIVNRKIISYRVTLINKHLIIDNDLIEVYRGEGNRDGK